jgi:hypothetical protein
VDLAPKNKRRGVEVLVVVLEDRSQEEDMIRKKEPLQKAYINIS